MTHAQKVLLRQAALERRGEIDDTARAEGALHFKTNFLTEIQLKKGMVIAGYWPLKQELDVMPLLHELLDLGYTCALPHVVQAEAPLVFRAWNKDTVMVEGTYGMMEPDATAEEVTPDLLIVPVVAFDPSGHRLGYGAGYYDMTFGKLSADGRKYLAVGAAFDQQCFDVVPAEAHDVHMNVIVTDKRIYKVEPSL